MKPRNEGRRKQITVDRIQHHIAFRDAFTCRRVGKGDWFDVAWGDTVYILAFQAKVWPASFHYVPLYAFVQGAWYGRRMVTDAPLEHENDSKALQKWSRLLRPAGVEVPMTDARHLQAIIDRGPIAVLHPPEPERVFAPRPFVLLPKAKP